MNRNIFIRRVGTGSNGRAWSQGVIDLTDAEQLAHLRAGGKATSRVTGIVNGLPDEAVARLAVGDNIAVETATVSFSSGTYTDADGAERPSVDTSIRVAGKASRTAAPVAQCDW
jgi:hypothetical protein